MSGKAEMRQYRVRPSTRSPAASGCFLCVFHHFVRAPGKSWTGWSFPWTRRKGAGRGFQERGARMAAQGGFRGCARPRFPDQGVGARCFLRRLSRCRRFAVGGRKVGSIKYPKRQTPRHHRRRRRLEWFTGSPVETRVAAPRRRTRPRHRSSPLPAGNEQMEQGLSPRRRGSSIACSRSSR